MSNVEIVSEELTNKNASNSSWNCPNILPNLSVTQFPSNYTIITNNLQNDDVIKIRNIAPRPSCIKYRAIAPKPKFSDPVKNESINTRSKANPKTIHEKLKALQKNEIDSINIESPSELLEFCLPNNSIESADDSVHSVDNNLNPKILLPNSGKSDNRNELEKSPVSPDYSRKMVKNNLGEGSSRFQKNFVAQFHKSEMRRKVCLSQPPLSKERIIACKKEKTENSFGIHYETAKGAVSERSNKNDNPGHVMCTIVKSEPLVDEKALGVNLNPKVLLRNLGNYDNKNKVEKSQVSADNSKNIFEKSLYKRKLREDAPVIKRNFGQMKKKEMCRKVRLSQPVTEKRIVCENQTTETVKSAVSERSNNDDNPGYIMCSIVNPVSADSQVKNLKNSSGVEKDSHHEIVIKSIRGNVDEDRLHFENEDSFKENNDLPSYSAISDNSPNTVTQALGDSYKPQPCQVVEINEGETDACLASRNLIQVNNVDVGQTLLCNTAKESQKPVSKIEKKNEIMKKYLPIAPKGSILLGKASGEETGANLHEKSPENDSKDNQQNIKELDNEGEVCGTKEDTVSKCATITPKTPLRFSKRNLMKNKLPNVYEMLLQNSKLKKNMVCITAKMQKSSTTENIEEVVMKCPLIAPKYLTIVSNEDTASDLQKRSEANNKEVIMKKYRPIAPKDTKRLPPRNTSSKQINPNLKFKVTHFRNDLKENQQNPTDVDSDGKECETKEDIVSGDTTEVQSSLEFNPNLKFKVTYFRNDLKENQQNPTDVDSDGKECEAKEDIVSGDTTEVQSSLKVNIKEESSANAEKKVEIVNGVVADNSCDVSRGLSTAADSEDRAESVIPNKNKTDQNTDSIVADTPYICKLENCNVFAQCDYKRIGIDLASKLLKKRESPKSAINGRLSDTHMLLNKAFELTKSAEFKEKVNNFRLANLDTESVGKYSFDVIILLGILDLLNKEEFPELILEVEQVLESKRNVNKRTLLGKRRTRHSIHKIEIPYDDDDDTPQEIYSDSLRTDCALPSSDAVGESQTQCDLEIIDHLPECAQKTKFMSYLGLKSVNSKHEPRKCNFKSRLKVLDGQVMKYMLNPNIPLVSVKNLYHYLTWRNGRHQ